MDSWEERLLDEDIDWLIRMVTPDGMAVTKLPVEAQRLIERLRDPGEQAKWEEREQQLKERFAAFDREASRLHCIVCSEIQWTQDMSGKNNVICIGCGRSFCFTHYLVHKQMESGFASPEEHLKAMNATVGREYSSALSIAERATWGLTVHLPTKSRRDTYTIFMGEYEKHWKHRCRTPIPHKDMNVLRAEQAILQGLLIDIDKEMESAPAEQEKLARPQSKDTTLCPQCSGTGSRIGTTECQNCHGTGQVHTCESCGKSKYCGSGPCTGWTA